MPDDFALPVIPLQYVEWSAKIDGFVKVTITLTTTGRKSRQPRPVTLYAFEVGVDLVVVGSRGGSSRDPAWVGNLRAEPRATVRVAKKDRPVLAREVEVPGDERDRLWTLVTEAFRYYATYQRKTERVIPLFVLEPATNE